MFVPNECMHNRISIKFIEYMVGTGQPFYCRDLNNLVCRFMYCGRWVNVIDLFDNGPCGILDRLSKILTGRFFICSSASNHKFDGIDKKQMIKMPFRWQDVCYYSKGLDSHLYFGGGALSVYGKDISSEALSILITPRSSIRTNNINFTVEFAKTYVTERGVFIFHSIDLKQSWPDRGQALSIIYDVEAMVRASRFPMAVWAKGRDWLGVNGWTALGRNDNDIVPYTLKERYNEIDNA